MKNKYGCVYLFKHSNMTPIKIGCTLQFTPRDRFYDIQQYSPYGAEFLGYYKSDEPKKLEKEAHKWFHHKRMQGEWFDVPEQEIKNFFKKRGYPLITEIPKYTKSRSGLNMGSNYQSFKKIAEKNVSDLKKLSIEEFADKYNLPISFVRNYKFKVFL